MNIRSFSTEDRIFPDLQEDKGRKNDWGCDEIQKKKGNDLNYEEINYFTLIVT